MNNKEILQKAKQSLSKAPEGEIRVSSSHNSCQFHNGNKYISKKQVGYIRKLAQKKYDRKVIKALEPQVQLEEKIKTLYDKDCAKQVYGKMNKELKKFIVPYEVSDEEYALQWSQVAYKSKERDGMFPTAKGDMVRSKSENLIADRLYYLGVPYRYEAKLELLCHGTYHTFFPDFTALNVKTRKEFIIEHFGMMDRTDYASNAVSKIDVYTENGYFQGKNILYTFESSDCPLNMNRINALIKQFLIG